MPENGSEARGSNAVEHQLPDVAVGDMATPENGGEAGAEMQWSISYWTSQWATRLHTK